MNVIIDLFYDSYVKFVQVYSRTILLIEPNNCIKFWRGTKTWHPEYSNIASLTEMYKMKQPSLRRDA